MRVNPFIQTLAVPYIRIIKRDVPMAKTSLDKDDTFEVETERHTRVYRNPARLKGILDFSVGGLRLYLWLIYSVRSSQPSIKLNEKTLCEEIFHCSAKQMQRMRQELIAAAVLAKKEANEYWINPVYFSSSDRLKAYPENKVCVATRREDYQKPKSNFQLLQED